MRPPSSDSVRTDSARRDTRASGPPGPRGGVTFPEELPISACVRDIAAAVHEHPVTIVAGETGSGKTTQLPKICLAMGRGLERQIGVTQPRRIAATSVAARVASELRVELGREVGYQIRFSNRSSPSTYVKFMTDGILLAEMQGDSLLRAYDTLIIDEAHERSLNIDFLLGVVKQLLPRRPDLRVIVSSATLETDRFAAFFGGAPVIQVSGRAFPVETIHRPPTRDESDVSETIANVVEEITELDPRGDVLVFVPGEREIRETIDELASHGLPHTVLLPLYGRLSQADQARVFQTLPQRRIIVSTNVAETSLTIPGVVYVIDAGLARVNRYQPRSGVTRLMVEPISRASADQRRGRAGRTRSGVCYRTYEEGDYALRPAHTDPELLRVGLAGVILQMKALQLGDITAFPFLDPPPKRAVDEGYRVLEELGAIDSEGELTKVGRDLARLPVDPRIGRMILAARAEGVLAEVLVIAAALGIQDPRERPHDQRTRADQAHARFRDDGSDFVGVLKLWDFYHELARAKTQSQVRKACRDAFVSYTRMREWADVHAQLASVVRDLEDAAPRRDTAKDPSPKSGPSKNQSAPKGAPKETLSPRDAAIHRAILPGLLTRVGMWSASQRGYVGARQTQFQLHPSSALARKPPAWIVAAELVETSQLFARVAARIDPAWLELAAGDLCKKSYGEASWSSRSAQAMISENVSLYGLPIVRDRKVQLGRVDPTLARKLFILHYLVRQDSFSQNGSPEDGDAPRTLGRRPPAAPPFIEHNRRVFDAVQALRDRSRTGDAMADEDAMVRFFDARIPADVHSGATFDTWRKQAESTQPDVLHLSMRDILGDDAPELAPEQFPNEIVIRGTPLPLSYRFDPSAADDGVTLTMPVGLLPSIDPRVLEWTIPGWCAEKITLLLQSLPKALRRAVGPAREVAGVLATTLRPFESPMAEALSRALFELEGARVPAAAFDFEMMPPYLRFHVRILEGGAAIGEGRDLRELRERFAVASRRAWSARARASFERDNLAEFPEALPVEVRVNVGGADLPGYPALIDSSDRGVGASVLESREAADAATRAALRKLVLLKLNTTLQSLERQLPDRIAMSGLASGAATAPRRVLAVRALDEAFGLGDAASYPRDRASFTRLFDAGRARLAGVVADLGKIAVAVAVELDKTQAALKVMLGQPGFPKATHEDVRSQMDELMRDSLSQPIERLAHMPRYLRAIQVRLERVPHGPQKDQAKADQVRPFWRSWIDERHRMAARGVPMADLEEFRWLIEELRVSVFAPELRAAVPISSARLVEAWKDLADRAASLPNQR